MIRRSALMNIASCLLIIQMIGFSVGSGAEDPTKSLVFRDRAIERNPFHFDSDNSRREMWNAFMLVKDANSGDPVAQHELGLRYLTGNGFEADTDKAAYWVQKAADQNLIPARYNLGIFLNSGLSVPWNPYKAYEEFKYTAEHGMVEGEYVYGLLFTDDLVVARNYAEAYRWLNMAADSGYAPAREVLAEFKKRGINTELENGNKASKASSAKSAASGSSSQTKQASLHPVLLDFGTDSVVVPGPEQLIREALVDAKPRLKDDLLNLKIEDPHSRSDSTNYRLIVESADAGNPEALTLIGYSYEQGIGVEKDAILASAYYLRAIRYESSSAAVLLWKMTQKSDYFALLKNRVEANDPSAQFSWAQLIAFGFDHQLTEEQALDLLTKAAQRDYAPALIELGIRHYAGSWVKQDKDHAVQLFRRAARRGSREALLRSSMMQFISSRGSVPDSSIMNVVWNSNDDGSVLAQEMLGYFYQQGIGVPKNIALSVKYYRKASQRGSKLAYNALRALYDELRPKDAHFQIED